MESQFSASSPYASETFVPVTGTSLNTLLIDHRTSAAAAPTHCGVRFDSRYLTAKRATDLVLSSLLLVALAPLWLVLAIEACCGNWLLVTEPRLGRRRAAFRQFALGTSSITSLNRFVLAPFRWAPALVNVLRGELSLVGPRPIAPREQRHVTAEQSLRFRVPPGLVSLHALRQRAGIDYAPEFDADVEYARRRSWKGDLALLLRATLALPFGSHSREFPGQLDVLGLPLTNFSMQQALAKILELARRPLPSQVCFVNADCANIASYDEQYRQVVQQCRWNFGDGIGIKLAGKLLGTPLRQNLCGTELFPLLCRELQGRPEGLFLLGSLPGVTDDVAAWIERNFPGVRVKGHHHGYFSAAEEPRVLEQIRQSGAEILLVAFGAPRQDVWIAQRLNQLGVKVAMGVGGLFDVFAGRYPRPPVWVRELCLTWAYRVVLEPRRLWKRYLVGNGVFLIRVARQALAARRAATT